MVTLYLIDLSGQGDRLIKAVPEQTYWWITEAPIDQPAPDMKKRWFGLWKKQVPVTSWEDNHVPSKTREDLEIWLGDNRYEGVSISRGSPMNDRALSAAPFNGDPEYEIYNPTPKEYYSFIEWLKGHDDLNVNLDDSYEGYIY